MFATMDSSRSPTAVNEANDEFVPHLLKLPFEMGGIPGYIDNEHLYQESLTRKHVPQHEISQPILEEPPARRRRRPRPSPQGSFVKNCFAYQAPLPLEIEARIPRYATPEDDDSVVSELSMVSLHHLDELSDDCLESSSGILARTSSLHSWTIAVREYEPGDTPWFKLSKPMSEDYTMLEGTEILRAIQAIMSFGTDYAPLFEIEMPHVLMCLSATEAFGFFHSFLSDNTVDWLESDDFVKRFVHLTSQKLVS